MLQVILTTVLLFLTFVPLMIAYKKKYSGKKAKKALFTNLGALAVVALVVMFGPAVMAAASPAEAAQTAGAAFDSSVQAMRYLAAALSTGLACIGGGIAVASGSAAAIGASAEDPKAFGKSIIFVALGEGVAIYGILISVLILFVKIS